MRMMVSQKRRVRIDSDGCIAGLLKRREDVEDGNMAECIYTTRTRA